MLEGSKQSSGSQITPEKPKKVSQPIESTIPKKSALNPLDPFKKKPVPHPPNPLPTSTPGASPTYTPAFTRQLSSIPVEKNTATNRIPKTATKQDTLKKNFKKRTFN